MFIEHCSTHANPNHHVSCLFNFFKSKMRREDSEENILMFLTRLCLKELEGSSPEVKVSELYMRRRCRERWSRMGEEERAAIFRLAGARDGNDLEQEDLGDNNNPNDGADAVEVEVDVEWQPEKKRKRSQSQRRPSSYNAFCLAERVKQGQKINNRCQFKSFCTGNSTSYSCIRHSVRMRSGPIPPELIF